MEGQRSALGVFGKLPFDVRELIWREFSPRGADRNYQKVQKSDLRIMRTSKAIGAEISRAILRGYAFHFDMFPYEFPDYGIVLRDNRGARWMFKGEGEFRARGFALFPWHKIDIYVNLYAIDPAVSSNPQFCLIWKRTYGIVQTLKEASSLRRVTVSFRECRGNVWKLLGIPFNRLHPTWSQIRGRTYGFARQLQHFNICYPHQAFVLLFLPLSHTSEDLQFNNVPDGSPDYSFPDLITWYNTSHHTRSFIRDFNQCLTQTHWRFEGNLEAWMWARARLIAKPMKARYIDCPIDLIRQIIFTVRDRPNLIYESDSNLPIILGPIMGLNDRPLPMAGESSQSS